jgi:arylsulfatase A-like enzyme
MSPLRVALARVLSCALLAACSGGNEPQDPAWPRNLVVISIDTLRADHLGFNGYRRPSSPNLDAFARTASVFRNAFSAAPKTAESHMSMFTSLYPTVHGVGTVMATGAGADVGVLGPNVKTIAGILRERGYATAGFHGGGFVRAKFGFDRGFAVYREGGLGTAVEWLEQNASRSPFFLFFHSYHVHDPYTPRPPFDTMFNPGYEGRIVHDLSRLQELGGAATRAQSKIFWSFVDTRSFSDRAQLIALYDGEIAEFDTSVPTLFDAIARHAPNTVIAVLSDHGEEFGDHGGFRHEQIYDELLRVPLAIRLPGQTEGRTVEQPVSLIDLAPTLLHELSVPPIDQFQGRVQPWFGDDGAAASTGAKAGEEIFSELPMWEYAVVRDQRWKLLSRRRGLELYDYRADPRETKDLLASSQRDPAVGSALERLKASLQAWQSRNRELHRRFDRDTEPLDPRSLDQLRALGYVE